MRKFNKVLSVVLAVLLMCSVIPMSVFATPGDVIMDASFNADADGFLFRSESATVRDGTAVLYGTLDDWANIYAYANAIQAGTEYTVSMRVKADLPQTLSFKINNGWTGHTAAQQDLEVSLGWMDYEFTVIADDVSSGAIVCIQTGTYALSGTTFYIDYVKITEKAPTTTGTNLLENGDFEIGSTTGWENLWGACNAAVINGHGHNDSIGLNIGCGEWNHFRQIVNVKPNTDYEATLWSRDVNNFSLLIKDGNDTVNIEQKNIAFSADWSKTTLQFNTGDRTSIIFSLMGTAADASGYFDDLSLVCLNEFGEPATPDEPALGETGLVVNGNFETGSSSSWQLYQNTKVDATAAKTGNYGLYIEGNGGWGGLGQQVINGLEVGKVYRISLWYKALSAGVNIQLCEGSNNSGAKLAYIYGSNTQWTEFAVEFEATTSTVCFALVGSGTGTAEKMYMDDVTLTEVVLGGNDDDPNLKLIDGLMSHIKTQGRTSLVRGTLMLDFTVSGIEFELDCAGDVYATFNAGKISNSAAEGGVYFTIVVDGVSKARDYCRISSVGETKVKLAEGLSAGKHTFAIYRQSEHSHGEVGVCALSFDGELLDKPADKDLYIEYIGDSISCGFGNLGNSSQGDGNPLWSDGTQAYTYIASKALNADWSTVSWSGLGCKYGYSSTTMQDVYPAQRYNYDKTTQYDFAKEPDVIVLALGTNDNSIQSDATLKRAGLVEMLQLVRAKNPNAPIVWIHGMMTTGVSAMIEEIVAEFGGADAGYYACKLTQNNAGGGAHPNLAGQQKFADELVAFLQENGLTEGNNTPDIPDEPVLSDDLISGGETSRMEDTTIGCGLAFQFNIAAKGIDIKAGTAYKRDIADATVTLSDGEEYKLVDFGAVVTNDMLVGQSERKLIIDNADNTRTKKVSAENLMECDENGATYAVRIIRIPESQSATAIYARPYYIYENAAGEQVVVYDEIVCANYDGKFEFNDGALEW